MQKDYSYDFGIAKISYNIYGIRYCDCDFVLYPCIICMVPAVRHVNKLTAAHEQSHDHEKSQGMFP